MDNRCHGEKIPPAVKTETFLPAELEVGLTPGDAQVEARGSASSTSLNANSQQQMYETAGSDTRGEVIPTDCLRSGS